MTRPTRSKPLQRLNTRARLMAVAILGCYAAVPAWAQTDLKTITAADLQKTGIGNFTATQGVHSVDVYNLASRTVANAANFHVLAGETFKVYQNSASDAFMVRVTSQAGQGLQQSVIAGNVWSNGQFWLQNAAGMIIKPGAVIDTARFVGALNVTDANFLAGKLTFQNPADGGKIVNQGEIKTPSGGSVYLIGTDVSNEGVITTPQGETILATGSTVNLVDTGTPGVKVEITGATGNTTNLGQIVAAAGRIGMAGVIVRNSGTLDASGTRNASTVVSEGGRIFLKASQDTYVDGKGRIVATGTKGGRAEVLGNRVAVMDDAEIDVSGTSGGGTILVGGDYQGKNPDVQNAAVTYFGPNAKLKADATDNGDGGKVIVWADGTTRAFGAISVRGGENGGNGGFSEVSGKGHLDFLATVDRRAPKGAMGTLLLDPSDIYLGTTNNYGGATFSGGVFDNADVYGGSYLSWTTVDAQLGLGNLEIRTTGSYGSGNIYITSGGTYNRSTALTLLANNDIVFSPWTAIGNNGTGDINLIAGWNNTGWAVNNGSGNIVLDRANVATNGAVTLTAGNNITITGDANNIGSSFGRVIGQSVQINAGNDLTISTLGTYGNSYIGAEAASSLSVTAGGIVKLQSAATTYGNEVHLMSSGTMNITADKLWVYGGTAGQGNRAVVTSVGSQTIALTAAGTTALLLRGGGSGASDYANTARIEHTGSGNQSITLSGNGAVAELRGGDGSGTMPLNYWTGECASGGVCSSNEAGIYSAAGNQTIAFTGTGGFLNLYGGTAGNGNSASIENKSATGTQNITGTPNIRMYGGTSGGGTVAYGGKIETLDNSAHIESKYGGQNITAGILYMYGGTASYGGAFLTGKTQNITAGAVTLEGGQGSAPAGYDIYGDAIWYSPAVIGHDASNTINLSVASLTMNGGASSNYGGSSALIGGYRVPTSVTITSTGNVMLSSANQWGDKIGSLGGYGGSVSITTTTGSIDLGKGYVGTGSTGSVTLSGYGGISQGTQGRIESNTLNATASQTGANITLYGGNKVNTVTASAAADIIYNSIASTHIASMLSSSGSITVTATNPYAYGGVVGLGTLTAANGTVSVTADQQIVDDNGTGTANISAQGITLVSTNGTTDSGGIAISADIAMSGGARTVSATVNNSATYGGISLRNGGSLAPTSVTMTDQSTTSGHAELTYLSSYNIDMTAGAYNLSSGKGGITFGSTGDVTLDSLSTFAPGSSDTSYSYIKISGRNVQTSQTMSLGSTRDLYINASGTLTVGYSIGSVRNIGLNGVGGLNLINSAITASGNAYLGSFSALAAGGVAPSQYTGGTITLNGSSVTASNSIYAYTGGDLRLNQASYLAAGYDVNLGLGGANSSLYLNDTTGYPASLIMAGAGHATNVAFPARSAGGIVIDGAATTTSTAYGSGIFVGNHASPAATGTGLNVVYGITVPPIVVPPAISNDIIAAATPPPTPSNNSGPIGVGHLEIQPNNSGSAGSSSGVGNQTPGGSTGQFGGGDTSNFESGGGTGTSGSGSTGMGGGSGSDAGASGSSSGNGTASGGDDKGGANGKKDDKKEDKKSDASGDKKDDKSGKKTLGKCSA